MNYLDILNEAFDAVERVVKQTRLSGEAAKPLTVGAFGDLTYHVDRVAEEALLEVVRRRLPGSLIISEEAGVIGEKDGHPLLLIDPVDGSTNASRSIPFYSSALTIVEGHRYSDVAAAGVLDLIHGDRIVSVGGRRVTFNGSPAHPSPAKPFEQAYINVNLRVGDAGGNKGWLASLLGLAKYPRFFGSAALETAYVAVGRSDAYVQMDPNLRAFDCIGSLYLVEEAGGWVKHLNVDIDRVDLREPARFAYVAACDANMGRLIMSVRV